ncbi:titin [Orussus abietinus]|uniref:titin n=1 Tax=Orussus abietinus TaxID=222816 RepID=UPI000625A05F|nr:titin [Orussus abietinus]
MGDEDAFPVSPDGDATCRMDPEELARETSMPAPAGAPVSAGSAPTADPDSPDPPTTTIGTIALQSGDTRIVIALLRSGECLRLEVLEARPGLAELGADARDAAELAEAHDQVLVQLQSKQSPVEELLRQADQLISTQKPRAEVYKAMAETLGQAWRDINALLERRKRILDGNLLFRCRAEECKESMRALESSCNDTLLPIEIEAVKNFLGELHDSRKAVLESLMAALQEGRALLDLLGEASSDVAVLDSRPGRIEREVERAILRVEEWLEELHDKRRLIEVSYRSRRTQLEQCLALALLATDLRDLEESLNDRIAALTNSDNRLGDSSASAELLLFEMKKLQAEAKIFQERSIKITRSTEQLVSSGHFAGEQATEQAYAILGAAANYLNDLERYESLLEAAISFFRAAQSALTKLDQLEVQLATSEHPIRSNALAQLHAQAQTTLETVTSSPLAEGYALLEAAGRESPGVKGVKRILEELETRKLDLSNRCTAHREENLEATRSLTAFLEKYNELYSWLVGIAEAFLQGHQDMGSSSSLAENFHVLHRHLLNDLVSKSERGKEALDSLPSILEILGEEERRDVNEKVEKLYGDFLRLKDSVETRVELSKLYINFHNMANDMTSDMKSLEWDLQEDLSENIFIVEEIFETFKKRWTSLQTFFADLSASGRRFVEEVGKARTDPYFDTRRACLCVEEVLERLAERKANLDQSWERWRTNVLGLKDRQSRFEKIARESGEPMQRASNIKEGFYPLLLKDYSSSLTEISTTTRETRDRTLSKVEDVVAELDSLLEHATACVLRREDEQLIHELSCTKDVLRATSSNYRNVADSILTVLEHLREIERKILVSESSLSTGRADRSAREIRSMMKEHESMTESITNWLKEVKTEIDVAVNQIERQEPPKAARIDVEAIKRIYEERETSWRTEFSTRQHRLEEELRSCLFDEDLSRIDSSVDRLSEELTGLGQGSSAKSLPAAKSTSESFNRFERTVTILEEKIETFIRTTEETIVTTVVYGSESRIRDELESLREKWRDLKERLELAKKRATKSVLYFRLLEEAEEWFREGSKLLVTVARRATTAKSPGEATDLLKKIEAYLYPGERDQEERIRKIRELSTETFGTERLQQFNELIAENREMLDSFAIVSSELRTLAANLDDAEELREKLKAEREEADAKLKAVRLAEEESARKMAESLVERTVETAEIEATRLTTTTMEVEKITQVFSDSSPIVQDFEIPKKGEPARFSIPLADAVVEEGQKFVFECRLVGDPQPEVVWYKDGISVLNNPDYRTDCRNDGTCSLTIEETFAEDSARFKCRAENAYGWDETSAMLAVKEIELEEQAVAPYFSKELYPSFAKEGSNHRLECTVKGYPLPTAQWFKNEINVDNSPDYSITYNNGEAILEFDNLTLEDEGSYTCKATNALGWISTSAPLTVEPLKRAEKPHFVRPLSGTVVEVGQRFYLECEAKGEPSPEFFWFRGIGEPLEESADVKIQIEGGCSRVLFEAVRPEDAGGYEVVARNSAGEASSRCNLIVEVAEMLEVRPPVVQVPLQDLQVLEGRTARLDCVIVGQPEPEVIWYHDGHPVKESADFQLLFQDDRCSLIVHEAFLDDAGMYKVVAVNSAGEASNECALFVLPLSELARTEESTGEISAKIEDTQIPPSFEKILEDCIVPEGSPARFECIVVGEPEPTIKWLLNDRPVEEVEVEVTANGGRHVLSLKSAETGHSGQISCLAENPAGNATCRADLLVERSKSPRELLGPGEPTKGVVEVFSDGDEMQASSSSEKHFSSETTPGDGGSRTVLTKMSSTLTQSSTTHTSLKKEYVSSTSSSTLAGPDHRPTSVCVKAISESTERSVAENGAPPVLEAHKIEEFEKIVQDQPGLATQEKTVVESRIIPQVQKSVRKSTAPRFVSPLTGMIVDQGTDVILEGIVDGYPLPTISWSKNGQELVEKVGVNVSYSHNHVRVELKNVNVKDAGRYTCTATNEVGTANSTADLVVKKTIFPPVFGRRLQAQVVKSGDRVIMEVEITGTPEPTVSWYKDDLPLKEQPPRIRIKQQGNCYLLIIDKASNEDRGKYMVRATNAGGEAQSIADFAVFEPTPDTMVEVHKTVIYENATREKENALNEGKKFVAPPTIPISDRTQTTTIRTSTVPTTPLKSVSETLKKDAVETKLLSETISSTVESHRSEIKSEEKFHVKLEHKTPDILEPDERATRLLEVEKENENVETSRIARKDALSFFESKVKEATELPVLPRVETTSLESTLKTISKASAPTYEVKIDKLTKSYESSGKIAEPERQEPAPVFDFRSSKKSVGDLFKKFEQGSTSGRGIDNNLIEIPTYEGYKLPSFASSSKKTVVEETSNTSKLRSETQESVLEGFDLVPEPPPEIGYMPKIEPDKKKRPDITIKAKQLQESHRNLSPVDAPVGGVKIFPSPIPKPAPKTPTIPTPTPTPTSFSIPPPFELRKEEKEVLEERFVRREVPEIPKTSTPLGPSLFERTHQQSHQHQQESVHRDTSPSGVGPATSLFSQTYESSYASDLETRSHVSTDLSEYRCHSAASSSHLERPTSPKPSADGLAMEKSWAKKCSEASRKSWPPAHQEVKTSSREVVKEVNVLPKGKVTSQVETSGVHEERSWSSKAESKETVIERSEEKKPAPRPIIYNAETIKVDHTVNAIEEKSIIEKYTTECDVRTTETTEKTLTTEEMATSGLTGSSTTLEKLKAPSLVAAAVAAAEEATSKPPPSSVPLPELILEPGPPPEIGFAPAPVSREKKLETVEKTLEMSLEHQPAKIPPGAIRTIPPPPPAIPPKDVRPIPPPLPATSSKHVFSATRSAVLESDYESDLEGLSKSKWRAYGSDNDEPRYRRVQPPAPISKLARPRSTEPEPLPPSSFEAPGKPQFRPAAPKPTSPPAPVSLPTTPVATSCKVDARKQTKSFQQESGYMADTDEPLRQRPALAVHRSFAKYEGTSSSSSRSETRTFSESTERYQGSSGFSTSTLPSKFEPPKETTYTGGHSPYRLQSQPFSYKPEAPKPTPKKTVLPPSPSKFVKGEFRESDYESDYEGRIPPLWKPRGSDTEEYSFKPVKPTFVGSGKPRPGSTEPGPDPVPPTLFEEPPKTSGPSRPGFRPIEAARPVEDRKRETSRQDRLRQDQERHRQAKSVLLPGSPPEIAYAPPHRQTSTGPQPRPGLPFHNAIGTETRNTVRMDESTENTRRIVTVERTSRVIKFGENRASQETGTFPRSRTEQVPTPSRFQQGRFGESESDVESSRVGTRWTPADSDVEDLEYRRVRAPVATSKSKVEAKVESKLEDRLDHQLERSGLAEEEFLLKPGSPPEYGFVSRSDIDRANYVAAEHMSDMTSSFRSKTEKFANDIRSDLKQKPILKQTFADGAATDAEDDPRTYREETRQAQYGTKHIDPDTGLIYFKYDFGYEFGIVLPGEGKKIGGTSGISGIGGTTHQRRASDIDVPIVHEFSTNSDKRNGFAKDSSRPTSLHSHFKPTKFTPGAKTVKWEPTSESEFSEAEDSRNRKNLGPPSVVIPSGRWDQTTPSPLSLSPSLPSLSPRHSSIGPPSNIESSGSPWPTNGRATTPTGNREVIQPYLDVQPKKAPIFIAPLRDIAVVNGQTARFECIVQAEPQPNILWSKDGRIIENSIDNEIHYRNGVCRLTIPRAHPEDAGAYSCTATNSLGSTGTSATLLVPGNRRSIYKA